MSLVESVPNFSEGRRLQVVDRLASAASSVPGAHLLDRSSDASHNRSVLTLAGEADAVCDALEAAVAVAVAEIDLEQHRGEHPRIGAVDVIPFVPLGDTSMADCIALARAFGARIADRFQLPVYLYADAATREDRLRLADIRRGDYETLRTEIALPERRPDFGPARTHPSAGAVAVGARQFLIAYNVNLDSEDVDLAKRIARDIRESSGGLPKVQAKGFFLEDRDQAQVSMNLLDFGTTPIWRAYEFIAEAALEAGVAVAESELVGLAPVASLLAVADRAGAAPNLAQETRLAAAADYLKLRDFSPLQALELRLEAAERAAQPVAGSAASTAAGSAASSTASGSAASTTAEAAQ